MKLTRRSFLVVSSMALANGCNQDGSDDNGGFGPFDPTPDQELDVVAGGDIEGDPIYEPDTSEEAGAGGTDADAMVADAAIDPQGNDGGLGGVDGGGSGVDGGSGSGSGGGSLPDGVNARSSDVKFSTLPLRLLRFPQGVMAGDVEATSAMFWTRYTGTLQIKLRVLEMDGSRIVGKRLQETVNVLGNGIVRVVVKGLKPGRRYKYAFLEMEGGKPTGRSDVGALRTAPDGGTLETIVFGGTSCTHPNAAPFAAVQHASTRHLDFFIHCGDHIYMPGEDATTLEGYREVYNGQWPASGLRALHSSTALYCTWDDQDVAGSWDPETLPHDRAMAAKQAYFEYHAIRKNKKSPTRVWRSFKWGRTAEIFVLDARSERKPSTQSRNADKKSVFLSRDQMNWLKAGLRDSNAVFKLIVSSSPIGDRGSQTGDGNWEAYASERREILDHIDDHNIDGVLWISGSVHFGAFGHVEASGKRSRQWEAIVGPGGSLRQDAALARSNQWPVVVINKRNFTVIRANPNTRQITVEYIGDDGSRIANSSHTAQF